MALIKCPECGKEISDSGKTCPNCGYPIAKSTRKKLDKNVIIAISIVSAILIIILVWYLISEYNRKKAIEDARYDIYQAEERKEQINEFQDELDEINDLIDDYNKQKGKYRL